MSSGRLRRELILSPRNHSDQEVADFFKVRHRQPKNVSLLESLRR
jgi:hypothetical protein